MGSLFLYLSLSLSLSLSIYLSFFSVSPRDKETLEAREDSAVRDSIPREYLRYRRAEGGVIHPVRVRFRVQVDDTRNGGLLIAPFRKLPKIRMLVYLFHLTQAFA